MNLKQFTIKVHEGFSAIGTLVFLFIIILVVIGGIVLYYRSNLTTHTSNVVNNQIQTPNTKTTDLAPGTPNLQKTAVLVMHSDSTYEKFLMNNDTVSNFIKSLPEGDKVISTTILK